MRLRHVPLLFTSPKCFSQHMKSVFLKHTNPSTGPIKNFLRELLTFNTIVSIEVVKCVYLKAKRSLEDAVFPKQSKPIWTEF